MCHLWKWKKLDYILEFRSNFRFVRNFAENCGNCNWNYANESNFYRQQLIVIRKLQTKPIWAKLSLLTAWTKVRRTKNPTKLVKRQLCCCFPNKPSEFSQTRATSFCEFIRRRFQIWLNVNEFTCLTIHIWKCDAARLTFEENSSPVPSKWRSSKRNLICECSRSKHKTLAPSIVVSPIDSEFSSLRCHLNDFNLNVSLQMHLLAVWLLVSVHSRSLKFSAKVCSPPIDRDPRYPSPPFGVKCSKSRKVN